jgi:hypothetical protein
MHTADPVEEIDTQGVISSLQELAGRLEPGIPHSQLLWLVSQMSGLLWVLVANAPSPVGTCERDGKPLFYQGREEGLFVCCSRGHCWPA